MNWIAEWIFYVILVFGFGILTDRIIVSIEWRKRCKDSKPKD